MSTGNITPDRSPAGQSGLPSVLVQTRRMLGRVVVAISFWLAIALPFLYLPLVIFGIDTTTRAVVFGVLLVCNAVALLVGHAHRRD